ncbi:MAG: hypothetical protein HPY73_07105 [Methanomassiliicoccales archaeon]|nr:MAG: hypothetical protein HPY73_07105 [Methanomassiliicoccales archaeon]
MPRSRKKSEGPMEEEGPQVEEDEGTVMDSFINAESSQHLLKSGLEFVQAVEKAIPKRSVPKEVKVHIHNIEKEVLLMGRALIDWKIKEIERRTTSKGKTKEPKMKKIELQ